MELAADALDTAGVERETHFPYRELLSTHLPEVNFRGKEHRRVQYAVLTAFAVRRDGPRDIGHLIATRPGPRPARTHPDTARTERA
jgi:hypothetical protein